MTEIWKDIKGYEGLYQVSNLGNVKSLPRLLIYSDGQRHYYKEKILRCIKKPSGYCFVNLYKDNVSKHKHIHRLVAEAFIPNPDNLPVINHKDKNPLNNRADNLEWCTQQYNVDYSASIKINQYSKDGVFIRQWKSASEASREIGICASQISRCCNGTFKSAYGFIWRYA